MSLEEIEGRAPGLLDALVRHHGIGLVVVRSEDRTVVLHKGGRVTLEEAPGDDLAFLALYDDPSLVKGHLLRLAEMPCAGDLLVFGAYDGRMVVNFEDHGGAHGGLGGVQQFPFMLSPNCVDTRFDRVTDATELHPLFVGRYQLNGQKRQFAGQQPSASPGATRLASG